MADTIERQADHVIYMICGSDEDRQKVVDLARPFLPSRARARPASVIHASLVLAGQFEPRTVSRSLQIGGLMRSTAFSIAFDTLKAFPDGVAALTCSERPAAFVELRRQLTQAPRSLGNEVVGGTDPHLTVAYECPMFDPVRLTLPLIWEVNEVQLVRSVRGETRHEVLGRWTLS